MIKCEIDGIEFKNGGVLARHLKKKYGLTYREYHHKYVLKSYEIPKCKCGCGEAVDWTNVGYRDYKGKHWVVFKNKTQNSWGHNPSAIEKSAETRRKQYACGERIVWSKGKTSKTNRSLKSAAKKLSKRFTPEIKQKYADRMRKMRKDGTIPTLYGEDHPQWKGGVSSVNQLARADLRLYKEWKQPILQRDGFKCTRCDNTKDLHVHHDSELFSDIIKKVMTIDDFKCLEDFARKREIVNKVVEYHIQHSVSGKTLCSECHNKLHPSLNFI